jgi:predicted small integral membrane protein
MPDLAWMAWTAPTAGFFLAIGGLIAAMGFWEWRRPGGGPRRGLLGITTTRGDRLFISLLGSAFLCLAWVGFSELALAWALLPCLLFSLFVFRTC